MSEGDVLDEVREAAAWVTDRARSVHVVGERIGPYAAVLAAEEHLSGGAVGAERGGAAAPAPDSGDPWAVAPPAGAPEDDEAAAALVLALDAVNFGSGWHPVVRKRPGCSGAVTMATNLREWVAAHGPLTAERLAAFSPALAHQVFDQPLDDPDVGELMALFAAALAQLGRLTTDAHDGSFTDLVASAGGSAAALVASLRHLPTFDDLAGYDGRAVPILKRAQITVADLHRAFGGRGLGRFHDLDRLTAFADNLVPHVLRLDGVLSFDPDLVARIDAGVLLEPGSPEEVEIRAVGLHAVELVRAALADQGVEVPSWHLDQVLWRRGGRPAYKAHPRHRARSPFY